MLIIMNYPVDLFYNSVLFPFVLPIIIHRSLLFRETLCHQKRELKYCRRKQNQDIRHQCPCSRFSTFSFVQTCKSNANCYQYLTYFSSKNFWPRFFDEKLIAKRLCKKSTAVCRYCLFIFSDRHSSFFMHCLLRTRWEYRGLSRNRFTD